VRARQAEYLPGLGDTLGAGEMDRADIIGRAVGGERGGAIPEVAKPRKWLARGRRQQRRQGVRREGEQNRIEALC
jgi:hypothetical protein